MKIKLLFAILLISLLITALPAEAHTRDRMPEPPRPKAADVILEHLGLPENYRPPASPPYEGIIEWDFQLLRMYLWIEWK